MNKRFTTYLVSGVLASTAAGAIALPQVQKMQAQSTQGQLAGQVAKPSVQEVNITVDGGYSPNQLVLTAGIPVRLKFLRRDTGGCTSKVLIPEFKIAQDLPEGKTTIVEFTPKKAGTYQFTCGMKMVRGTILVNSSVQPIQSADPHAGHNMSGMNQSGHNMHNMANVASPAIAKAKLSIAGNLLPQQPLTMTIDIKDLQGKSIAKFDTFQEKLMHLIVVSDDLSHFDHIHPTYQGNGRFVVQANFPKPGKYSLFSDYKPADRAEQVSVLQTQIPGKVTPPPTPSYKLSKVIGMTQANLQIEPQTVTAGQMVNLNFNLVDTKTKQPIADLQPYLGERGHMVIVRQASQITRANYIHAHAMPDTGDGKIQFMTSFPQPGQYKLWGQFSRGGAIVVADFWVNVQ
jgi:Cupredoxin-like domain